MFESKALLLLSVHCKLKSIQPLKVSLLLWGQNDVRHTNDRNKMNEQWILYGYCICIQVTSHICAHLTKYLRTSKTLSFYLGSITTIIIVVHIQSKLFKIENWIFGRQMAQWPETEANIKRIFYMKFNSDLVAIGLKRVKKDDKKMDNDLCLRLHYKKINSEKAKKKINK